ncbi:MAG: hypothetical protein JEZ07_08030 [Phycisphaerae bacterium]|nr:hypothetical protein [Phycisphaerae bacterium]
MTNENKSPIAIEQYHRLTMQIDQIADELVQSHKQHIICKEKCCSCCVNLSVFPVEFYAIKEMLEADGVKLPEFDDNATCGCLADSLCVIYKYRPVICRSHGLPIAFLDDLSDPPEMSVSFCEFNFTEINIGTYVFDQDNTLNVDAVNIALHQINQQFIAEHPELKLDEQSRIPIKDLFV